MSEGGLQIAVLTYRRPDGLARLLDELAVEMASSSIDASVLVVDNDDRPSAEEIVGTRTGVRYVHEPRPGIAAGRNRALDESRDARFLVFVDDDEVPRPGWLDALIQTWNDGQPAAVVGPVISEFTQPLDPWIELGGFFQRIRHRTGTVVDVAATNNLLLDLDVVRANDLRFDERFSASGGSDVFFTRSLVRCGGRIVWCDEAEVTDVVPAGRQTREWVTQRAIRAGNTESRVAIQLQPTGGARATTRVVLAAKGTVRIVVGGLRASFGRLTGRDVDHARGVRTVSRGRGMVRGAMDRVVIGYHR